MPKPKRRRAEPLTEAAELRIIGGEFRGRKLRHEPFRTGDDELVTRPMKHRLRESIFNLVGLEVADRQAFDLFAGTGALGLEAISRGARHATFIERHVPTARVIEENIAALGAGDRTTVLVTSAFLWGKRDLGNVEWGRRNVEGSAAAKSSIRAPFPIPRSPLGSAPAWLVFFSPPYDFFVERQADMLSLIESVMHATPAGSILVVEADGRFDVALLPASAEGEAWDVRTYAPAVVGVWRKAGDD
jgi:16S rRNA (guanine966-N2)-methyltransferase